MVTNEKLVDLIKRLENKILVLENRIEKLEGNSNTSENREIDLNIYINMIELTCEDLNMVLINNFIEFIKLFIKNNKPPLKRIGKKIYINIKNNCEEFKKEHSDKIIKNIHKKLINIFTIESQKKDISLYINKVLLLEETIYDKAYDIFKKYDK
jgi:hypothetical protein